ncbi:hypothetical protein [Actinomadura oligospora]|uniref:hypothetical protein n=1 Tax=Actinomadura oligospora TaxID=111804 RepID=UPI0004B73017|nr:hypothetical protein [Actinomadura oligospora]
MKTQLRPRPLDGATARETVAYFNGPVQNGDFTLADDVGKATGMRIAAAANALLDVGPVPHLWNTVTLAGDLARRGVADRAGAELAAVVDKYDGGLPGAGVLTDTDPDVVRLTLELVEHGLTAGTLAIEPLAVPTCVSCGHLAGTAGTCRACGSTTLRSCTRPLLTARRPGRALGRDDFHATACRPPAHLIGVAAHVPDPLILSRTRAHGVGLEDVGLPGLVLDPRAGVHVTVLAAARKIGAGTAVMTATAVPIAHVAAYGAPFRAAPGLRLRYGLHGFIPYDHHEPHRRHGEVGRGEQLRELLWGWFLPLYSLHARSGVRGDQLPALVRFLRRALLARPDRPDAAAVERVRAALRAGDTRWLTDAALLPHVLPETVPDDGATRPTLPVTTRPRSRR